MDRIITIDDLTIDLGNIKLINLKGYAHGSDSNIPITCVRVVIELLNGKEYVYNQETGLNKLIKPRIIKRFGTGTAADLFVEQLKIEWSKYLTELENKTEILK